MANADNATIFALFVEPGFEGQNLGRNLMNEAGKWLAEMGIGKFGSKQTVIR